VPIVRLFRRLASNPVAAAALFVMVVVIALAIVAPILWTDASEKTDVFNPLIGSSGKHLFGTDRLGRDVFYRTLVATRKSMVLAVAAAALGMLIGIPFGILPSVLGGRSRRFIAAVIGSFTALPGLLLALFVATIIGIGATGAVVGIGIANAPVLARLSQTLSASVANKDYVAAARMLGASRYKLLSRHILPNVAEPIILTGTMSVGWCLLEIAALSYLGLGVRAPEYDWGNLLQQGTQAIYVDPLGALGPAAFVVLGGLSFALLGESLTSLAKRVPSLKGAGGKKLGHRSGISAVAGKADSSVVLHADGLTVQFPSAMGAPLTAVNDVTFELQRGEMVGIVGESGSGKSLTALAVAQLVAYPGHVDWRELRIDDEEISTASAQEQRRILGSSLALVSQDPMTALNPALRVGTQLAEVAQVHRAKSRKEAHELAVQQLGHVQISEPERRAKQFPYEFSGGMRQRAVIAMGLMGEPKLILADEPTTALDVTVQRQVLQLLTNLNTETGAAILLISHDIAVVTNVCSRVLVMYGGRIVEDASSDQLLSDAAHPYARALIAAVPTMTSDRTRDLATIPGRPPTLAEMPPGCPFAARCPLADERCVAEMPPLETFDGNRRAACWHPQNAGAVAVNTPTVGSTDLPAIGADA
jgi:peptide/nickel transport system permease protein